MSNGYLSGRDAIDVAKMSGVQLYRAPCSIEEAPDTAWQTAEAAIAAGADPEEFFLDLDRLAPRDSGSIILSLVGMFKAWHDNCIKEDVCPSS